jgi:V8-like Glu-specific endopeptidase
MAAAVPGEQLVRAASPDRVTRRPGLSAYLTRLAAARAAAPATDRGSTWRHGGLAARTTGKVFFSLGGGDYVCSGSAVSSPDRSTVLTAGHCVHDPDVGAYATRWVFVPGYARDARPYGMFPAAHLAAPAGWRTGRDYDVDLAFVDVDPNEAGRLLTDVVGGQPVAFATPRGRAVQALGYPAQDPWDGELLIGCSGPVRQDPRARASTDQGLACTMTGGSSGGPWLSDFDPVTGRGTLTSVTSFGYTDEPGVLWGPYLGSVAKALYTSVASTRSR